MRPPQRQLAALWQQNERRRHNPTGRDCKRHRETAATSRTRAFARFRQLAATIFALPPRSSIFSQVPLEVNPAHLSFEQLHVIVGTPAVAAQDPAQRWPEQLAQG